MNTEIWKDISGYEGIYQISTCGRVKSLNRRDALGYFRKEKFLKSALTKNGYLFVGLLKNKKRKLIKIHRLVCSAFLPNPENKPTVNHKDGNKINNNLNNLEWATYSENHIHALENNLCNTVKGENCYNSLLEENSVKEIRKLYKTLSQREIAHKYNVCPGTIWGIIHRKSWKHVN